jgi:hypothetical protein
VGHVVQRGGYTGDIRWFRRVEDHAGVRQIRLRDPEEAACLQDDLRGGVALVWCGDDAAAPGVGSEEGGDE